MSTLNPSPGPQVDHSAVAERINAETNFTMFAVFREERRSGAVGLSPAWRSIAHSLLAELDSIPGLATRGWYDISGFRADADLMIWWHAPSTEALQRAYRTVLEWTAGRLAPVWSNIGVHRAAEFNRGHVPAFLAGDAPGDYVCVYPFVRSKDWYLLPDAERRDMLREHGAAAKEYGDVLANTVAAFALGDYEWLLAFESGDLLRIVDLMRELRATEARRFVTEEIPFFTGPRVDPAPMLARILG
ncbi:chlorite dismutase [Leucobacter luti]|uniref:hydrogen peroxide-dependent heme synthase n=1 Tax=Leucobacter luti TaxID=340320 RepID=UPI00104D73E8|nr:hydrogen peroxide-dependent heme synthase [Leucobacter luti]MCW2287888.1 chlorite dismutase [Leucobacter luti]TCK45949.1 chlorite dismutase [Leucobacter luti]